MKPPFSIIAAAAAAMAALVRMALGGGNELPPPVDPHAASPIPPMTPNLVERYALSGGTNAEISDRFLVDEAYLLENFGDLLRRTRGLRRIMLRSYQLDGAKKANATILTWLGRNELGQSNNPIAQGEQDPDPD